MKVNISGGGLAGCEAAYQLLKRGVSVTMYEMKTIVKSPAHTLDTLCELVCSNSLKSNDLSTSSGVLKQELRMCDSLVIRCADMVSVPAGGALAVDRDKFSQLVTDQLTQFDNFTLVAEVASEFVPLEGDYSIVATGPLTDQAMIPALQRCFGEQFLYFFDAVAPIVTAESIDYDSAFVASRYNKGSADYVNCPMNREQYDAFYNALVSAECVQLHNFENNVFEGCMPIEVMASRGINTMRFGPLKPVGLVDDRHPEPRPYAVVQLRKENLEGSLYNLVGFQTHLKFGEQKRVFSLIPALANAEFVRYGVMHRNTFINAPLFLDDSYCLNSNRSIYFAGQMTGVEGYVESIASGLVASIQLYRSIVGQDKLDIPPTTMTGALCQHVCTDYGKYQPMNSNFGILAPMVPKVKDKLERKKALSARAIADMQVIADIINKE